MNEAVTKYTKTWFPEVDDIPDPCLEELLPPQEEPDSLDDEAPDDATKTANCPVLVTAQDYGQSLVLPHFGKARPNVDYFQSDLNIHMFNVCDIISQKNKIYLYDERLSGKDGNTVNSLRWNYYQDVIKNADRIPALAIKVMDNCVGQNKSQLTMLFDALCSLLLFERVADFFLIPGHSHMRPDNVTGLCKMALKKKNLFLPEQLQEEINQVKNMQAVVMKEGEFYDWSVLKKYMNSLPGGFTANYMFEFVNGKCIYKRLYTDLDDMSTEHAFVTDPKLVRKLLLRDIFDLPETATPGEIVRAKVLLPRLAEKKMTPSREKSIAMKLHCVPQNYRAYYPGYRGETNAEVNATQDEQDFVDPEPSTSSSGTSKATKPKKKPGRPKKIQERSLGTPSMIKFMLGKRPPENRSEEPDDTSRPVIVIQDNDTTYVRQPPPKARRSTAITVSQNKDAVVTTFEQSPEGELGVVKHSTGRQVGNIFEIIAQPTPKLPPEEPSRQAAEPRLGNIFDNVTVTTESAPKLPGETSVQAAQPKGNTITFNKVIVQPAQGPPLVPRPIPRAGPFLVPIETPEQAAEPLPRYATQCPWARPDPGVDDSIQ